MQALCLQGLPYKAVEWHSTTLAFVQEPLMWLKEMYKECKSFLSFITMDQNTIPLKIYEVSTPLPSIGICLGGTN